MATRGARLRRRARRGAAARLRRAGPVEGRRRHRCRREARDPDPALRRTCASAIVDAIEHDRNRPASRRADFALARELGGVLKPVVAAQGSSRAATCVALRRARLSFRSGSRSRDVHGVMNAICLRDVNGSRLTLHRAGRRAGRDGGDDPGRRAGGDAAPASRRRGSRRARELHCARRTRVVRPRCQSPFPAPARRSPDLLGAHGVWVAARGAIDSRDGHDVARVC